MPAPRSSYQLFALEQLARIVPVRARSMFGGISISAAGLAFALLADDVLYLKVNDANRPDFEALGLGPFRPFGPGGPAMQYYEVSAELLEDPGALGPWVDKALDAARAARRPRQKISTSTAGSSAGKPKSSRRTAASAAGKQPSARTAAKKTAGKAPSRRKEKPANGRRNG